MQANWSRAEAFFEGLRRREKEHALEACFLMDKRHELRSVPVLLGLGIGGISVMAQMRWQTGPPWIAVAGMVVGFILAVVVNKLYIKTPANQLLSEAITQVDEGGWEVKEALISLVRDESQYLWILDDLTRAL